MSIITIEGCKVYDGIRKKSIIINSDSIDECMNVYRKYQLDGVAITTAHGYKLPNVDFLAAYPGIEELSVSEGIKDISAIHSLGGLRSLMVSGRNRKIDFSNFPLLAEFTADWSAYFSNMDYCTLLENLSLYRYAPKSKDFSDISNITWVKKLMLSQSTIETLRGLDDFNQLEDLSFNYCSKLTTLCSLEKSKETLVSLLFDHCKSLSNLDYAILFQNLEILAHHDGGTIPSINFIKNLPHLKSFRFMGTDIADGDLSPCIGLEYVAFTKKKHFSHSMEVVNAINSSKQKA